MNFLRLCSNFFYEDKVLIDLKDLCFIIMSSFFYLYFLFDLLIFYRLEYLIRLFFLLLIIKLI